MVLKKGTICVIDKVTDECTGCNACYSKCPMDAIAMEQDPEGFLRPMIDMKICTQCGLCKEVCPALVQCSILDTRPPQVFAAWSRDEEQRINSTSGGIFSELAKQILENSGHVVGACYKADHTAEHTYISDVVDLPKLRQSKYLQSEMVHTYREVETLLKIDDSVLFCGTPCHVAGLLNYLGKEYKKLIVCDFICRGVPSPMIYKMYLADLEKEYGASIESIQFKNKNIGWNQFCTFIRFKNGKTYQKDRYEDAYMFGYLITNLYLRPSCYQCKFKELPRVSDITLGDFWGIGNTRPHLDQNKGTSVVFLNTERGREFFIDTQQKFVSEECTFEEALGGNPHILHSVAKSKNRKKFFLELRQSGSFVKVMQKYQKTETSSGIRKFVARFWKILHRRLRLLWKTQI
jgi:coenzyme F420-reducing hydrogenase beta subunit